jgi:hypothetical protein
MSLSSRVRFAWEKGSEKISPAVAPSASVSRLIMHHHALSEPPMLPSLQQRWPRQNQPYVDREGEKHGMEASKVCRGLASGAEAIEKLSKVSGGICEHMCGVVCEHRCGVIGETRQIPFVW